MKVIRHRHGCRYTRTTLIDAPIFSTGVSFGGDGKPATFKLTARSDDGDASIDHEIALTPDEAKEVVRFLSQEINGDLNEGGES